jgi:hypothetical protein
VVLVADPTIAISDFDKLETVVFANEKIGLAFKAFRAVRMSPEAAGKDPILKEEGKTEPRILIVDPVKEKVKVLEENRIKVSSLYSEMKKAARSCYKENLDKCVKTHLKMLTEQDQLANEIEVLTGKESKLAEDGAKSEKKLEKVRKELEEVRKELDEITTQQKELWNLTPKHQKA